MADGGNGADAARGAGAPGDRREAWQAARQNWLEASLHRHRRVLAALQAGAEHRPDEEEQALGWLGVRGQADRSARAIANWGRGRSADAFREQLDAQRELIEECRSRAEVTLAGIDGECRQRAERRLGLRLAVVGKGGAGKTVLSATLARLLARRGRKVLVADLDTNPGLVYSLGLGPVEATLPPEATEEHPGAAYGWQLSSGLSPEEVVERHTLIGPDGVRYLGLGKIGDEEKGEPKRTVVALLQVLGSFSAPDWDVIGDLEAGPTTPFERYHAFADRALVVVGPAWRSALTARRLLRVLDDVPTFVVANRFRDEPDHEGLLPAVRIPFDECVAQVERRGLAPLDHCAEGPAVRAIDALVDLLVQEKEVSV